MNKINIQTEKYKRFCIIEDRGNGTETLEDYSDEQTAKQAFEAIKTKGYHIPENECGNIKEAIVMEKGTRFSMDCEFFDEKGQHLDFGTIEHKPFVLEVDGNEILNSLKKETQC